jgi:hypothetical protein
MKLIMDRSVVIVFLLAFANVSHCQQHAGIRTIEFSKTSRGYEAHTRIGSDSLHVWIENRIAGKPPVQHSRKLEPGEWTALVNTLEDVDIKEIPSLPSPSMKRIQDAALHSTLTITLDDGHQFAHSFDNENPHSMLKPLLESIQKIANQ